MQLFMEARYELLSICGTGDQIHSLSDLVGKLFLVLLHLLRIHFRPSITYTNIPACD